jgi:hypothetical protein
MPPKGNTSKQGLEEDSGSEEEVQKEGERTRNGP